MSKTGNNLVDIIYFKFDDVGTGSSVKNNLLRDELKECIPTAAITKTFSYSYKNKTVTVQWKQFPLKLGHDMHKCQGSTLEYMKGYFDCTSENDIWKW